jgi:hypothetical protein
MSLIEASFEFRGSVRRLILGWTRPQTLASEKARGELNTVLKQHWSPQPIEVYELILEHWEPILDVGLTQGAPVKDDRFIVFIDPEFDVDWISNGPEDAETSKYISAAESIGARRCKHLPNEQILEFRRLIGQAIVDAITGNYQQSAQLSGEAAQFLRDRTVERSRSWTLTASAFVLLGASAALFLIHNWLTEPPRHPATDLVLLRWAIQGGTIGAYLSVIRRAGRGEWDAAAGRFLHFLEVVTKLFAGCVLGIIAFALSRSVNAPLSLRNVAPDVYSSFVLGVAAGLFEQLIPNMISVYADHLKAPNPQPNET